VQPRWVMMPGIVRVFAPISGGVSGSFTTICFARFLRVFGG
jgi:hypothetical protein